MRARGDGDDGKGPPQAQDNCYCPRCQQIRRVSGVWGGEREMEGGGMEDLRGILQTLVLEKGPHGRETERDLRGFLSIHTWKSESVVIDVDALVVCCRCCCCCCSTVLPSHPLPPRMPSRLTRQRSKRRLGAVRQNGRCSGRAFKPRRLRMEPRNFQVLLRLAKNLSAALRLFCQAQQILEDTGLLV